MANQNIQQNADLQRPNLHIDTGVTGPYNNGQDSLGKRFDNLQEKLNNLAWIVDGVPKFVYDSKTASIAFRDMCERQLKEEKHKHAQSLQACETLAQQYRERCQELHKIWTNCQSLEQTAATSQRNLATCQQELATCRQELAACRQESAACQEERELFKSMIDEYDRLVFQYFHEGNNVKPEEEGPSEQWFADAGLQELRNAIPDRMTTMSRASIQTPDKNPQEPASANTKRPKRAFGMDLRPHRGKQQGK